MGRYTTHSIRSKGRDRVLDQSRLTGSIGTNYKNMSTGVKSDA